MQFGHALACILRHILLADPHHGAVYILKVDIADGFYRIDVNPDDIPKLGVVFPSPPGVEPLVALPLVLPMGWKNSPPAFCTATETIADLANAALKLDIMPKAHGLGQRAAKLDCTLHCTKRHKDQENLFTTIKPDPSLPRPAPPTKEVDVYVDDFIAVAQGNTSQLAAMRDTLLHSIDQVFQPNDEEDAKRAEPVSLKKLDKGDASWSTKHTILGWDIDTVQQTIALPPHRIARLKEILDSIEPNQRRIGMTKWYNVLGELRSTSIALPGSRGLFSHLQAALNRRRGCRIHLTKEVHQSLQNFRWILAHIADDQRALQNWFPFFHQL
jgi:hypothetical protein